MAKTFSSSLANLKQITGHYDPFEINAVLIQLSGFDYHASADVEKLDTKFWLSFAGLFLVCCILSAFKINQVHLFSLARIMRFCDPAKSAYFASFVGGALNDIAFYYQKVNAMLSRCHLGPYHYFLLVLILSFLVVDNCLAICKLYHETTSSRDYYEVSSSWFRFLDFYSKCCSALFRGLTVLLPAVDFIGSIFPEIYPKLNIFIASVMVVCSLVVRFVNLKTRIDSGHAQDRQTRSDDQHKQSLVVASGMLSSTADHQAQHNPHSPLLSTARQEAKLSHADWLCIFSLQQAYPWLDALLYLSTFRVSMASQLVGVFIWMVAYFDNAKEAQTAMRRCFTCHCANGQAASEYRNDEEGYSSLPPRSGYEVGGSVVQPKPSEQHSTQDGVSDSAVALFGGGQDSHNLGGGFVSGSSDGASSSGGEASEEDENFYECTQGSESDLADDALLGDWLPGSCRLS